MSKSFLPAALAAILLAASIGRAETHHVDETIELTFVGAYGSAVRIYSDTPVLNRWVMAGPYGFTGGPIAITPLFCIDIYQTISTGYSITYTFANLEDA